ncbi:unnamed protein product [Ixodes pacificus]
MGNMLTTETLHLKNHLSDKKETGTLSAPIDAFNLLPFTFTSLRVEKLGDVTSRVFVLMVPKKEVLGTVKPVGNPGLLNTLDDDIPGNHVPCLQDPLTQHFD